MLSALLALPVSHSFLMIETSVVLVCTVVTACTPLMIWFLGQAQARYALMASQHAEQVRVALVAQTASSDRKLDEIHASMNGERTDMIDRLEAMHAEILKLTSANVTLTTQQADKR